MSTQTFVSTKMLTVITFQWWQYGWFLILFCMLIYATHTMLSWSHFVMKLSSSWRDTAGFRKLPCPCCGTSPSVSSPASLLGGLWVSRPCSLTAPPPDCFCLFPLPQGERDTQPPTPPQFCRTLPKAQPLLPAEPLRSQGAHLHSNTSQTWDPPWGSPGPYFPSLQNWENTSTSFTMLLWGQKRVHIKYSA